MTKPSTPRGSITRREALGIFGAVGASVALGCRSRETLLATVASPDGGESQPVSGAVDAGPAGWATDAGAADAGFPACVLDPNMTEGPYWVDEKLNRSDVRSDTNGLASPNPRPGVPLALQFTVVSVRGGACTPIKGAQVDIWHSDGIGLYSDVVNMGPGGSTVGQDFLRGYQITDASGTVRFTTIYPGWYPGRTIHIHVRMRLFDAGGNTTTEATTQVFFDDSLTDTVFASNAPYDTRGPRDTLNSDDMIYQNQTELLLDVQPAAAGYTTSFTLGVQLGTVNEG